MNLNLVNLTGFALAYLSGVHAADVPAGMLRGFLETENCDEGMEAGRKDMKKRWEKSGEDCANAWYVDDAADKTKSGYPETGRNWKETEYNQCARMGVDKEKAAIEKECFEDSPKECIDLGEAAAGQIALTEVCNTDYDTYGMNQYAKQCRELAYDICKGNVASAIAKYCPNKMPSKTSQLTELADMCPETVNDLIGYETSKSKKKSKKKKSKKKKSKKKKSSKKKSKKKKSKKKSKKSKKCLDKEKTSPERDGDKYKIELEEEDAKCTDKDDRTYQYGQFKDVKTFSECAEKCVEDVKKEMLDSFRGIDFKCEDEKCNCLYDEDALDDASARARERYDMTSRDQDGDGKVKNTKKESGTYCGKVTSVSSVGFAYAAQA